jgi:hypothetical protein
MKLTSIRVREDEWTEFDAVAKSKETDRASLIRLFIQEQNRKHRAAVAA